MINCQDCFRVPLIIRLRDFIPKQNTQKDIGRYFRKWSAGLIGIPTTTHKIMIIGITHREYYGLGKQVD